MSAIATKTNNFVKLLEGTGTTILDTRKTTPGFRAAEKWAVKIGGGENHRFALYDMIMLKDNHNDFAGGISSAIHKTKAYLQETKMPSTKLVTKLLRAFLFFVWWLRERYRQKFIEYGSSSSGCR